MSLKLKREEERKCESVKKKRTRNKTAGDVGSIVTSISTLISIVIIVIVFYTLIQAIGDTRVATGLIGGLRTMFGDFINGNFTNIKNVF